MKLLVSGCSHSAGAELVEQWHPGDPGQAFGQHIADYFNFETYVNIAGAGYSNQWIYHKTLEFLENIDDPQNWFVIIGWTNACRVPLYDYQRKKIVHMCPAQDQLDTYSRCIRDAYPIVYGTMLPLDISISEEHYRIIGMQMTLQHLGIRYLFFDAVSSNHENRSSKLIDLDRYYRYNQLMNSYWNYYLTNVWDKSKRWANHAPASYHKEWANHLIDFIQLKNILS